MRTLNVLVWGVVMVMGGAAMAAEPTMAELKRDNEQLRAENAALKQRVAELEAQLGVVVEEKVALEQEKVAEEKTREARYLAPTPTTTTQDEAPVAVQSRTLKLPTASGSRADHYVKLTKRDNGQIVMRVEAYASGRIYGSAAGMMLTIDDQTTSIGRSGYEVDAKMRGTGARRKDVSDEVLTFAVSPTLAEQIGKAGVVEAKVGYVRFAFTRELQEMFLAVLAAEPGA